MANYGKRSTKNLNTAHHDLIVVFNEVVKVFDNTIVYGNRSATLQKTLFKKGRSFINGWVITNKKAVVTYCDGIINKSDHNYIPSKAVDAVPYPIDWEDTERMYYFAGYVKGIADRLLYDGKISHHIGWGGDWDNDTEVKDQTFMDLAHFYIIT